MEIDNSVNAAGDPGDWSTRRADARINHERILAAAVELFAEKGVRATIPQIAERAGVGKATVYRSYPTKDALVAAVAAFQSDWLRDYLERASERTDDPHDTLRDTLYVIAERFANDRALAEVLPETGGDLAPLERIMAAGRQQGTIRKEATAQDIRILLSGVARVLFEQGEHDPATWRRYANFVLNAVSTHSV